MDKRKLNVNKIKKIKYFYGNPNDTYFFVELENEEEIKFKDEYLY